MEHFRKSDCIALECMKVTFIAMKICNNVEHNIRDFSRD